MKKEHPVYAIVPEVAIPAKQDIVDVPMDDPQKVYNVCLGLQELCDKEQGIGISAVQVGVPWKLFLVKGDGTCPLVPKGEYGYFVNCEYKAVTDERVSSIEGCLSLRSSDGRLRSFLVERHRKIRLFGFRLIIDNNFLFEKIDAIIDVKQGAIVFEHEADHHSGILISNIGREIFVW